MCSRTFEDVLASLRQAPEVIDVSDEEVTAIFAQLAAMATPYSTLASTVSNVNAERVMIASRDPDIERPNLTPEERTARLQIIDQRLARHQVQADILDVRRKALTDRLPRRLRRRHIYDLDVAVAELETEFTQIEQEKLHEVFLPIVAMAGRIYRDVGQAQDDILTFPDTPSRHGLEASLRRFLRDVAEFKASLDAFSKQRIEYVCEQFSRLDPILREDARRRAQRGEMAVDDIEDDDSEDDDSEDDDSEDDDSEDDDPEDDDSEDDDSEDDDSEDDDSEDDDSEDDHFEDDHSAIATTALTGPTVDDSAIDDAEDDSSAAVSSSWATTNGSVDDTEVDESAIAASTSVPSSVTSLINPELVYNTSANVVPESVLAFLDPSAAVILPLNESAIDDSEDEDETDDDTTPTSSTQLTPFNIGSPIVPLNEPVGELRLSIQSDADSMLTFNRHHPPTLTHIAAWLGLDDDLHAAILLNSAPIQDAYSAFRAPRGKTCLRNPEGLRQNMTLFTYEREILAQWRVTYGAHTEDGLSFSTALFAHRVVRFLEGDSSGVTTWMPVSSTMRGLEDYEVAKRHWAVALQIFWFMEKTFCQ